MDSLASHIGINMVGSSWSELADMYVLSTLSSNDRKHYRNYQLWRWTNMLKIWKSPVRILVRVNIA